MKWSRSCFRIVGIYLLGWGFISTAMCSIPQEVTEQIVGEGIKLEPNKMPSVNESGTQRLVEYKDWVYHQTAPGEPYKKLVPGVCPQWIPKAHDGEIPKFYMFLPLGYEGKSELWIADIEGCLWGKAAEGYFHVNAAPILSPDGKVLVSVYWPPVPWRKEDYRITAIEINKGVSEPSIQQWLYHSEGAVITDLKYVDMETISFVLNKYDETQDKTIKEIRQVKLYRNVAESFGNQKEYFLKKGLSRVVSWDYAKEILTGEGPYYGYSGGKQYHSGWVTIKMNNGTLHLTKPPEIDDFFDYMKENNLSTEGFASE